MDKELYSAAMDYYARTNMGREFVDPYITLPSQLFSTAPNRWRITDCPICLEPFKGNEWVSVISCGHIIHHTCLCDCDDRCPLCRIIARR